MKQRRWQPGEAAGAAPAKPAAAAAIDAAGVDARASGKAAAASDDGLDGLDLRRHWCTQCFRDANVGYHSRRRQHRSFTPALIILLLVSWAHDMFLLDFSAVDTSDVPLVVATALQLLAPFVSTGIVLVAKACQDRHAGRLCWESSDGACSPVPGGDAPSSARLRA